MTIMLWGITTERVRDWAADDRRDGSTLTGLRGLARHRRRARRG